jgi:hypothetical protein
MKFVVSFSILKYIKCVVLYGCESWYLDQSDLTQLYGYKSRFTRPVIRYIILSQKAVTHGNKCDTYVLSVQFLPPLKFPLYTPPFSRL